MNYSENTCQALDSLRWYAQMGVDVCVEDSPQRIVASHQSPVANTFFNSPFEGESNRTLSDSVGGNAVKESPHRFASANPAPPQGGSTQAPPPASIASAVAEARALADAANDLAALEAAVRGFTGCALKKTATNTVFAQGFAASRVMFVGEAPGTEDDRSGQPFSGPQGQLLDAMLGFIGLNRTDNCYITTALFWRPPGNRQPTKDELEICKPFVEKHIALINPKLLVLVGGTATASVLGDARGITRLRGQVFSYKNDYMAAAVPVHVLYHPIYLLRQPLAKKQAWADILKIKAVLS